MSRADQGVSLAMRDFSRRFHLISVAAVAAALLVAYVTAKKLIFG